MRNPKIIAIIMTYQCAHLVEKTYQAIPKDIFNEILIVDDGSFDDIAQIAKKLPVKFFTHQHLGYGGNLKFGLKIALKMGADYIVDIHGDGQYDPQVIPLAIRKAQQGYDLLLGTRFQNLSQTLKDGMPMERFLANIIFSAIDRVLFQIPLSEFYNGFRIYSQKLLTTIPYTHTANDYFYSFQIIIQAKFYHLKIGEIPIRCNYKNEHTSESFWQASLHSLDTLQIFIQFLAAKLGFKTPLFI